MTNQQERTVDVLNDVLSENLNAERAYEEAIQETEDERLRELFQELHRERQTFAMELNQYITRLGGDPVESESLGGRMHAAWMSLQASLSSGKTDAMIDDLESSEESLADVYDEAIARNIQPEARDMLQNQRRKVHTAENRIEDLRKALTT